MSDPGYLAGLPSHEWIARMSDALAASRAEVARLREALEPFANCAERYTDAASSLVIIGNPAGGPTNLTVGDLRCALAASQPQGKTTI